MNLTQMQEVRGGVQCISTMLERRRTALIARLSQTLFATSFSSRAARLSELSKRPAQKGAYPLVSVIVPVFEQEDCLIKCLLALERQDYAGAHEVIVVNNGQGVLDIAMKTFPNVVIINESTPGSYHARNAGIVRANGSILAFTDADCVPAKDWISNGVKPLLADPSCGVVGGRVRVVPVDAANVTTSERLNIMFGFGQKHYIQQRHFAATANMLTRKDVVEKVGCFRGDLRSGGDAEWGFRVHQAGYGQVYQESSVVNHPARGYDELIRKMRRVVAGARDKNPDWISCLRWCMRRAVPPRHTIRAIRESNSSNNEKVRLIGLAVFLRWRSVIERLWIQVGRHYSPRS